MKIGKKLPQDFYLRNTLTVARDLLGKNLVRIDNNGISRGIIVETEAYGGRSDQASHVFGNKLTERTKVWFDEGGKAYVYTIYGIYFCLGITTGKKFDPGAVLIRSLEPIDGIEIMKRHRKVDVNSKNFIHQLCSGPSKVCQAMKIDRTLYGQNLNDNIIFLEESNKNITNDKVGVSPRIGIDYSKEAALYPWRFYIKDNDFVSNKNYKGPKNIKGNDLPLFVQE